MPDSAAIAGVSETLQTVSADALITRSSAEGHGLATPDPEALEQRPRVAVRVRQRDGTLTHDGLDSESRPPPLPLTVRGDCTTDPGGTDSFRRHSVQDTNRPPGCRREMSLIDRQGDRDE
jgi:hypothetical protein